MKLDINPDGTVDVLRCSSCGLNHRAVELQAFDSQTPAYFYCPSRGGKRYTKQKDYDNNSNRNLDNEEAKG